MPLVHYHSESVLTYFVCAADLAALSTSCKFRLFPEPTCTLGFPARRKWDLSVPLTHACHISGASCGTRLHKRGQRKKMLLKQCGGGFFPSSNLYPAVCKEAAALCVAKTTHLPRDVGSQCPPAQPGDGRGEAGQVWGSPRVPPSLPHQPTKPGHTKCYLKLASCKE